MHGRWKLVTDGGRMWWELRLFLIACCLCLTMFAVFLVSQKEPVSVVAELLITLPPEFTLPDPGGGPRALSHSPAPLAAPTNGPRPNRTLHNPHLVYKSLNQTGLLNVIARPSLHLRTGKSSGSFPNVKPPRNMSYVPDCESEKSESYSTLVTSSDSKTCGPTEMTLELREQPKSYDPVEALVYDHDSSKSDDPAETPSKHRDSNRIEAPMERAARPAQAPSKYLALTKSSDPIEAHSSNQDLTKTYDPIEVPSNNRGLPYPHDPIEIPSNKRDFHKSYDSTDAPSNHGDTPNSYNSIEAPSNHRDLPSAYNSTEAASDHRDLPKSYNPIEAPSHHRNLPKFYDPVEEPSNNRDLPCLQDPTEISSNNRDLPMSYDSTDGPSDHGDTPKSYDSTEAASNHRGLAHSYNSTEAASNHRDLPRSYNSTEAPSNHLDLPDSYNSTEAPSNHRDLLNSFDSTEVTSDHRDWPKSYESPGALSDDVVSHNNYDPNEATPNHRVLLRSYDPIDTTSNRDLPKSYNPTEAPSHHRYFPKFYRSLKASKRRDLSKFNNSAIYRRTDTSSKHRKPNEPNMQGELSKPNKNIHAITRDSPNESIDDSKFHDNIDTSPIRQGLKPSGPSQESSSSETTKYEPSASDYVKAIPSDGIHFDKLSTPTLIDQNDQTIQEKHDEKKDHYLLIINTVASSDHSKRKRSPSTAHLENHLGKSERSVPLLRFTKRNGFDGSNYQRTVKTSSSQRSQLANIPTIRPAPILRRASNLNPQHFKFWNKENPSNNESNYRRMLIPHGN